MKHLIMGTAGHIDHGKTALIKTLTGIECDTHREERERGITIHLGFAHLALEDGSTVGIIDVPGHRDFVHTMLGGASGIDFVLLVVAADSGVMPQTREHLRIMEILEIRHGIIALTKIDLVDDALLELCRADVQELVAGSFLQAAPIIPVSAKTAHGLSDLLKAINRVCERVEDRPSDGIFRMNIDRIFTASGFGTVVTGTVVSGKLALESKAYVLPGKGKELRIRRMERHGVEVGEIRAGDRASLNLARLDKSEIRRGMIMADRVLADTLLFDATLTLYEANSEMGVWSQVMFHSGTYENQARVHLIDRDALKSGETGIVQCHLVEPCVLSFGDRFVIRNSSSDVTLGGGKVIDAAPLHHRRRSEKLVREIKRIAQGDIGELVALEVGKHRGPVAVEEIGNKLNLSKERVLQTVKQSPSPEIVLLSSDKGDYLVDQKGYQELERGIVRACAEYHRSNPISERGINLNEIRGALKLERSPAADEVLGEIIEKLIRDKRLREINKTWLPAEVSGKLSESSKQNIGIVDNYFRNCGMQTPIMNDLRSLADQAGIKDNELKQILHYLSVSGKICRIEDNYLHQSVVDSCREKLIEKLKSVPDGLSVSEFRDLVGGNRKLCLLLFSRYDSEGLTVRKGDRRYPREKRKV
ncbi:MAG: selenocysteine-specific translation elongation factor [Deltaproteobacteria bacterium]|nr:selenocysteine-specific translation elongation factor [Deltaproteobacteria bacterium]